MISLIIQTKIMDNITSKTPYRNPKNKSAQDQNHKKKKLSHGQNFTGVYTMIITKSFKQ